MSIKRLFDAVERRGDIGRRVAALVLPISNRPRVTSSCAGKLGLREPGKHTSGPNLASRDNVAHHQTLYTIVETPPPAPSHTPKHARCRADISLPGANPAELRGTGHRDREAAVGDQRAAVRGLGAKRRSPLMTGPQKSTVKSSARRRCCAQW